MSVTNLVGTVVPTEQEVVKLEQSIRAIYDELKKWGVMLSLEDRKAVPKARPGAEKLMPLVANLATERKVSIEGIPLEGMTKDLQVGNFAARIEAAVEPLLQIAADTRLVGQGEAWQSFLGHYAILSSMATRDPGLAKQLAPVADFMATGPRTKKKPE